jgi:hypothetical protein
LQCKRYKPKRNIRLHLKKIKSKAQGAKQTHGELKISQKKVRLVPKPNETTFTFKMIPSNQFHHNEPFQTILKKKNSPDKNPQKTHIIISDTQTN